MIQWHNGSHNIGRVEGVTRRHRSLRVLTMKEERKEEREREKESNTCVNTRIV
jgi:hypothetical protein